MFEKLIIIESLLHVAGRYSHVMSIVSFVVVGVVMAAVHSSELPLHVGGSVLVS